MSPEVSKFAPEVNKSLEKAATRDEIAETQGVSEVVAQRLADRFGSDVKDTDRELLESVKGVGPATARKLNPPTSEAYDTAVEEGRGPNIIGAGPLSYRDDDGVIRLLRENPERVADEITTSVKRAHRLVSAVQMEGER